MPSEIKSIRYNPSSGAYEGRIDITRGGVAYRYPCAIEGPMDMSHHEVRRRMESQARAMSDTVR